MEAISPVLFGDPWAAWQIVHEFERRFAEEAGYRYAAAVQSGSAGLRLGLLACGVKPGDEVITVANSDIATTAAISHCGATPVLCDVLASDYTMDPDRVEDLLTERTVGLLPVDLYGHPANVRSLRELADRYGLFIVEDAALALGARDHGHPVGAFADMAVFSCAPHKPFEAIGPCGVVVTEREELRARVALLSGYGLEPGVPESPPTWYHHAAEGYNLRMSPVNAAVLSVKLPYLKVKVWSENRRFIGTWYRERLATIDGVDLPAFRPESEPIFRTYTVQTRDRDRVYQHLREGGVQAALHFVPPVHLQPVYQHRRLPGADRLPVTEGLAEKILCLPVDPTFTPAEVDYVCGLVRQALEG
ncbi:MAG: DegT/DnrJ/EryC1/StrS family aminotransferase [Anaerolineae bacterium]